MESLYCKIVKERRKTLKKILKLLVGRYVILKIRIGNVKTEFKSGTLYKYQGEARFRIDDYTFDFTADHVETITNRDNYPPVIQLIAKIV